MKLQQRMNTMPDLGQYKFEEYVSILIEKDVSVDEEKYVSDQQGFLSLCFYSKNKLSSQITTSKNLGNHSTKPPRVKELTKIPSNIRQFKGIPNVIQNVKMTSWDKSNLQNPKQQLLYSQGSQRVLKQIQHVQTPNKFFQQNQDSEKITLQQRSSNKLLKPFLLNFGSLGYRPLTLTNIVPLSQTRDIQEKVKESRRDFMNLIQQQQQKNLH